MVLELFEDAVLKVTYEIWSFNLLVFLKLCKGDYYETLDFKISIDLSLEDKDTALNRFSILKFPLHYKFC